MIYWTVGRGVAVATRGASRGATWTTGWRALHARHIQTHHRLACKLFYLIFNHSSCTIICYICFDESNRSQHDRLTGHINRWWIVAIAARLTNIVSCRSFSPRISTRHSKPGACICRFSKAFLDVAFHLTQTHALQQHRKRHGDRHRHVVLVGDGQRQLASCRHADANNNNNHQRGHHERLQVEPTWHAWVCSTRRRSSSCPQSYHHSRRRLKTTPQQQQLEQRKKSALQTLKWQRWPASAVTRTAQLNEAND